MRTALQSMCMAPVEGPVLPVRMGDVEELAAIARRCGAKVVAYELERAAAGYAEPCYPISRALSAYDNVAHPSVVGLAPLQMPWFRDGLAKLCRLS